jgi:hypothetical protein
MLGEAVAQWLTSDNAPERPWIVAIMLVADEATASCARDAGAQYVTKTGGAGLPAAGHGVGAGGVCDRSHSFDLGRVCHNSSGRPSTVVRHGGSPVRRGEGRLVCPRARCGDHLGRATAWGRGGDPTCRSGAGGDAAGV